MSEHTSTLTLSIVSPVYNEEAVAGEFIRRALEAGARCGVPFELILVNDGSTDTTAQILDSAQHDYPESIRVIHLARNFGHQLAITAGIDHARGEAVMVLDCDLQDPPELIPNFLAKWREGSQIVYGQRTERRGETWFKRVTADLFYRLMRRITNIDMPHNAGDFYLLDRTVVDVLKQSRERHRFIRGLISWTGFRKTAVPYKREARYAGKTKYSLWRMIIFSLDAMTSFSSAPLRLISLLGFIISGAAFLGILWTLYLRLFTDATIHGWSSLMVAVLFIGGIQLLAIGVIGEYVARIGDDVKGRPLYTIMQQMENGE